MDPFRSTVRLVKLDLEDLVGVGRFSIASLLPLVESVVLELGKGHSYTPAVGCLRLGEHAC